MPVGPLVMMARLRGARGWHVRVASGDAVELSGFGLEVFGASVSPRGVGHVALLRGDARVQVQVPDEREPASLTVPFLVTAPGGVLEVVLFRVDDARSRVLPSPRVLTAIDAIRADDPAATRLVLCDVLEEVGAVAEAEYVRLELELQGFGEVDTTQFLDGVRRLRALSSVVGPTFRYLVGRDIAGCSGVRWAFRCPRAWDEMLETDSATERVCSTCRQVVVRVTDEAAALRLAREGVCASVRIDDEAWDGELVEPDGPGVRGAVAAPPRPRQPVPSQVRPAPRVNLAPSRPWWKRLLGR
ncbi:MAG: hypothetical protein Q8L14_02710 [Myxococcales bacterium]|nr:hypothetical protein [Myxococcales bacterium]